LCHQAMLICRLEKKSKLLHHLEKSQCKAHSLFYLIPLALCR
jgi:hypothetical protein